MSEQGYKAAKKTLLVVTEIGTYRTELRSNCNVGLAEYPGGDWKAVVAENRDGIAVESSFPLHGVPMQWDNHWHLVMKEKHCMPFLISLAKGSVLFHPHGLFG